MRQAATVLLDSLRMLRASMLFWISIWISALVALIYASIGFTDNGISVLFGAWNINAPMLNKHSAEAEAFYLLLFSDVIARYWLGWFSLVLALISTCSIFPNFLQVGSIELALSKPISRVRLFLLKYTGGLLFVAVQTGLFCLIVFFALGFRLNEWNVTIFWAVPIITFSFSLIYCVSVFIGLVTRSTVFALLGAILFWGAILIAQWTEDTFYKMAYLMPDVGVGMDFQTGQLKEAEPDAESGLKKAYQAIHSVTQVLPKTRECTHSLKRLIKFEERDSMLTGVDLGMVLSGGDVDPQLKSAMEKYENRHSWFTIIGTSLLFELIVMGATFGIFARRDY
jgi:hypothetical protein